MVVATEAPALGGGFRTAVSAKWQRPRTFLLPAIGVILGVSLTCQIVTSKLDSNPVAPWAPSVPLSLSYPETDGICKPRQKCSVHNFQSSECFPRVFILASYPTSGNSLFQKLFAESFRVLDERLIAPKYYLEGRVVDGELQGFDHVQFPNSGLRLFLSKHRAPYGLATHLKTHFPTDIEKHLDVLNKWERTIHSNDVVGVVHLARNPGDQLLRDWMRWRERDEVWEQCNGTKVGTGLGVDHCYNTLVAQHCEEIFQHWDKWNDFHQWWFDRQNVQPAVILQYEQLAEPATVQAEINRAFTHMNLTHCVKPVPMQMLRVPSYRMGTLFASACGVDMARDLHNNTRHISQKLGYSFDNSQGHWKWSPRER